MRKFLHFKLEGKSIFKIIGWIILGVIIAAIFALLFGIAVMFLWNWLMPQLFGLSAIGYWQAFGLLILCKLLFGGLFSRHGHKHTNGHHAHYLFHNDDEDDIDPRKYHNYYSKFWKEKGKSAFEEYVNELESSKNE